MNEEELAEIFEELSIENSEGGPVTPGSSSTKNHAQRNSPVIDQNVKRSTRSNRTIRFNSKFSDFVLTNQRRNMKFDFVVNEYETAESSNDLIKGDTGIIYDDYTCLHECPWDPNYLENPNRYRSIMHRCNELGLLNRCIRLPYQLPQKEYITKLHNEELYEKLKILSGLTIDDMEKNASDYDSIYFNQKTFDAALVAVGSAISLVEAICTKKMQNGIAIIRPPGHHAMQNEYCGFCYFNNVAIAAQHALDKKIAERILIVDIDVHHGQATQRMFYDSKNVLYFSIHRFENGLFWPNLRESNFDYIGNEAGLGYNINFPLNAIGLTDSDYFSIVFQILLPTAYEFNPDLVIVSAGYDACIGCPEGEMEVTPAFYGHLITLLSGLANGRIAVCLEGGYFLPSLAEGVAMTIKALLGDGCGTVEPLTKPHLTTIDTINDLRIALRPYWKCFHIYEASTNMLKSANCHKIQIKFEGEPALKPYPTRNCYPVSSATRIEKYTNLVNELRRGYESVGSNQKVACCYDDKMLLHNSSAEAHVENSSRLMSIYKTYKEWNLDARCLNLTPKPFNLDILENVHNAAYVKQIVDEKFSSLMDNVNDMYYNQFTFDAIVKANECLLTVVDEVLGGYCRSGAALIRPPGHHAEANCASGFCFINNVAVAAKYILNKYQLKKILIVDFDIHHGNGTQDIFYEDNRVMYISIHKYSLHNFFPNTPEGNFNFCGEGDGEGCNVNIALVGDLMHNIDYMTMFFSVILPIAYSYSPDVVLVSAGFDAGIHDPLGNYRLTPECYGHLIQLLKPLASGKMIIALEGGYNQTTLKYAMNICIKTLLGDPLPTLTLNRNVHSRCMKGIRNVKMAHKQYWPILDIDRRLLLTRKAVNSKDKLNTKS